MFRAFVESLNIGRPQLSVFEGRTYSSAINRRPAPGAITLGPDGFAGDRVSNTEVHGGPDKAVCVYPGEHYAYWRERLGRPMPVPSFGENLTTRGFLETDVCIGDVYAIGKARVQVSQPRQPCGTLARMHGLAMLPKWVNEQRFTGFYFRVLEAGAVAAGDEFSLIERDDGGLTVHGLTGARLGVGATLELAARLAALPALSASWRAHFASVAS